MELTTINREPEPAKSKGLGKATDSDAASAFAAGGGQSAEIETTLGDLIVALTDETHQFVADERQTYELVAYLLSERLSRRSRNRQFAETVTKRTLR